MATGKTEFANNNQDDIRQEWYTLDEAAGYLRVSKRKIYQLLQTGQLSSYQIGMAGRKRIRHGDLDQVMHKDEARDWSAMNASTDPILAELWNNEKDAEYDKI